MEYLGRSREFPVAESRPPEFTDEHERIIRRIVAADWEGKASDAEEAGIMDPRDRLDACCCMDSLSDLKGESWSAEAGREDPVLGPFLRDLTKTRWSKDPADVAKHTWLRQVCLNELAKYG